MFLLPKLTNLTQARYPVKGEGGGGKGNPFSVTHKQFLSLNYGENLSERTGIY